MNNTISPCATHPFPILYFTLFEAVNLKIFGSLDNKHTSNYARNTAEQPRRYESNKNAPQLVS